MAHATIGYGDVPPPTWRVVEAAEGLCGALMLGCTGPMVFAVVARPFETAGRNGRGVAALIAAADR